MRLKWLGWVIVVLTILILILAVAFTQGSLMYFIALYGGIIAYLFFRPARDERWPAFKKVAISAITLLVLLMIEWVILNHLYQQFQQLQEQSSSAAMSGSGILMMFAHPSIVSIILLVAAFIIAPLLAAFLEGQTQPDADGLCRNVFLVLLYTLLTLGVYELYWFLLIKKGLLKRDIKTKSLWWFLVPIVGAIIVYIDFSKALEIRTKRKFATWFLIFFFCSGIDVVINQAIINYDISKETSAPALKI